MVKPIHSPAPPHVYITYAVHIAHITCTHITQQRSAVLCSTKQYSAVLCSTKQYSAVLSSTKQYSHHHTHVFDAASATTKKSTYISVFSNSDEEEEDEDSLQFLPITPEIDDPEENIMVPTHDPTYVNVSHKNVVYKLHMFGLI